MSRVEFDGCSWEVALARNTVVITATHDDHYAAIRFYDWLTKCLADGGETKIVISGSRRDA